MKKFPKYCQFCKKELVWVGGRSTNKVLGIFKQETESRYGYDEYTGKVRFRLQCPEDKEWHTYTRIFKTK